MANWLERARHEIAEYSRPGGQVSVSQRVAACPVETQVLQGSQLAREETAALVIPAEPCSACGCGQWWQQPGEPWHCRACKPNMSLEATTLTLPCHKVQTHPVRDPARLRRVVELACRRLTITPEVLWKELAANGDLADLELGAVSVKILRQVAMTLGAMRAQ